jgi:GT2 family glycosyltransferase
MHLRVDVSATAAPWWAKLELADSGRSQVVRESFLGPLRRHGGRQTRAMLLHVPREAGALQVQLYGDPSLIGVQAKVLGRPETTLRLLAQALPTLPASLRGTRAGMLGRLRAALGQGPARAAEAPPYAMWLHLFGALPPPVPAPPVQLVVVGQDEALIARSLAAAGPQAETAVVVRTPADWPAVQAPWVLILGAGEILAEGAVAAFAAAAHPGIGAIYADLDVPGPDGARSDPLFKPGPDHVLIRSGLLTRGACLVPGLAPFVGLPAQADAARLMLALAADRVARIARVLTHVPPGRGLSSPEACVEIVQADLQRRGLQADVGTAGGYVRATPTLPRTGTPRVSLIVPSACTSAHVLHCLRRVATCTDYLDVEILLAVSDISASNTRQARLLDQLRQLPGLRVLNLHQPDFNYATVNNLAAREATGDMLVLLNDDVAPIHPSWLRHMLAYMQDPRVGAVGPRLLYGNDMVQHGGVVMGLANLCEHADRFRAASDAGPHGLASLDRQVSAVTAACMLVRAGAYAEVGGMDEGFRIALNDVDLCMRLREKSWRIVYAAGIELYHYESLSLGRHYAGTRAGLEGLEVRRLRARWHQAIADDPYYNQNASLEPWRIWQPAFPPRGPSLAGTGAKPAAPD